jgi:hypothetical protein
MRIVLTAILLAVSAGCSNHSPDSGGKPAPAPLTALPSDPCAILGRRVVATTVDGAVTSAERVANLAKTIATQNEGRPAGPGTLCDYHTDTRFGSIFLRVPIDSERSSEAYWSGRRRYFDAFPGSAKLVSGLGQDAWLGGGAMLHVLIREGAHFSLSTQLYQRDSERVLIELAREALERFA